MALAIGLFRGPELRLDGGEVDPDPLAIEGLAEVEVDLIGMGATAVEGLMISVE